MGKILITGVSTGIGYSLTNKFINLGFRVFGSVRSKEDGLRLSADFGKNFYPLIFDVTDHKSVDASVDEVKNIIKDESLNCLINNAGIAIGGPVMHTSLRQYVQQFEVNFFGLIAVTKAYLPLLGASKNCSGKPGRIINMSSVSGQFAFPFLSPYCASKFALEAFNDSLRRELMIYGIDVISIEPGPIKTPIWKKSAHISNDILNSDYSSSMQRFGQYLGKLAKNGMEVNDLADKVINVYLKNKPKCRYMFTKNKFTKFTVPRYLIPSRKMDRIIYKSFFRF